MIKLKIIDINNYDYTFIDSNNKEYILNIEFYGIDKKPEIGDYIYMHNNILKEKNLFSFGLPKNINRDIKEDELIKIVSDNKEYYLQRYYG